MKISDLVHICVVNELLLDRLGEVYTATNGIYHVASDTTLSGLYIKLINIYGEGSC